MKYLLISLFVLQAAICYSQRNKSQSNKAYFPTYGEWKEQSSSVSFDTAKLAAAIQFAKASEVKQTRSMELSQAQTFGKEPFGQGVGPFSDRGDQTGIILHKGYIVASWGEPLRVDMTHSVTKSFLSSVIGLAVDAGLIKSVNDPVAKYVPPIEIYDPLYHRSPENIGTSEMLAPFASPHNRTLTWDVMLRQTSDWEGTLWGKPEWADRPDADVSKWLTRKRNTPGSVYEYNDVRVNALALAATCVWRKPLPQVLKEQIMDPIGASNTWRWTGYRNSWIVLDGQPVQSVSGGGHWGGGMFINAYDMARFGLLTLHKGHWNGRQLISEQWIKQSVTPTSAQPGYGFMNFFVNADKKFMPNAPSTAFVHVGNGTNIIYVDAENDIVMVARWIETKAVDGLVQRVLAALKK
jgi:CubicO group peptidase (beta-lactamase class C family)